MQVISSVVSEVNFEQKKEIARKRVVQIWGENEWSAFDQLVQKESGWNEYSVNPSSGACGLFQNINCTYQLGDVEGQIEWGVNYIKNRFGTPSQAWRFWQKNKSY